MDKNYIYQIQAILTQGNLTYADLANRLSITTAALSRWVNGHAKPQPKRLKAIEKLYLNLVRYPSINNDYVKNLLKELRQYKIKNLWKKISNHSDFFDDLLLEHTYNSTAIEGTTLSKNETKAVIFSKQNIPNKTFIEHLEVANHASVLMQILRGDYTPPINEKMIKAFHLGLLQGIREDAGSYSKHHRAIQGYDMELTHPEDIPEEMMGLLRKWRRLKKASLQEIAEFHADFELIHPFGDGNGRVGRLIIAIQCLELDYPPIVIENQRKTEYYDVLAYAQQVNVGPFLNFLVSEMAKTFQLLKKHKMV